MGASCSDMDGQMARWAEYFGQLFTVDPPTEQLHTTGLQAVDADPPPIDETAPSLDEVREAVAKLKGGKAAGVCNISAELLRDGGEAMIRGLHAVLTAVWQSGPASGGSFRVPPRGRPSPTTRHGSSPDVLSRGFRGLFSRPLTQEFGWRPVALSGSAMACVGMTLSAFAPSPAFLFFSFSLLTGFGGGIVTCQCFTILPHYFQRLRGLTNAIMMSGICTGLFVGPPFARYLQDTYGFRGATLILGGVLFNSCIGASFFHPYEWHQKKVPAEEQPEELQVAPLPINSKAKGSPSLTHGLVMSPSALSFVGSTGEPEGDVSLSARARLLGRLEGWKTSASSSRQSSRYNSTLSLSSMDSGSLAAMPLDDEQEKAHRRTQRGRQDSLPVRVIKSIIKDMGALKSLRACIICFGATMSISARLNFLMMVPFAMMDAGFSKDTAAWSVSVSAGCNLVTRVLVSVLSDFPRFNKRLTYMFGFMLVASSITAFTVFSTPNTLLAVMAVYGVGVGASMGIYNLVIIDVMGVERLAEVFGASSCCVAVGFICIGPLIGFIRDVTQSYAISMRVAAGMYVLGLAAWAFMSQAERYDLRRELRKAGKEATKA
ncbi:Monocarboxylate transporter 9 [Chionoecetes opilio]|uniref:Monocarboxylate transporter 9 n=1 Tax=Chionoecetes opilio TaxID=41210 RepID=A0A8J4YJE4_CHIOP|nr:Monocarboxylate transporter 9 [Chionoecetes opilio]